MSAAPQRVAAPGRPLTSPARISPHYAAPSTRTPRAAKPAGGLGLILFGVILPTATIAIELTTHICTDTFFDPVPTFWHVLLALSVPAANCAASITLARGGGDLPSRLWPLGALNGVAIAAGVYFAVLFLPLLPLAIVAIVVLGLGLLPMSPLFGAIAAVVARYRLGALAESSGRPLRGTLPGIAAAALLLACLAVPGAITSHGLDMASSGDGTVREEGVRLLRRFGSERRLLEACYERDREFGNPWSAVVGRTRPGVDHARQVLYRVTGRPFDSLPDPTRGRASVFAAPRRWDDDQPLQGGEAVGTLLPGLSMARSEIDGWVSGEAATAYFEWTLEFSNNQPIPPEARARIALPRGGCVTRLTLWINGEEREAAWGGRAQVRGAYERVVKVERRDPVLVTSAGPDRVMMQCYPVPPNGMMKVRVGVTAPLELASADRGTVTLPRLLDHNFEVPSSLRHSTSLHSRDALTSAASELKPSADAALDGGLSDSRLSARVQVSVGRDPTSVVTWFDDSFDKEGAAVVQTIGRVSVKPPARLILALDGSAPMQHVVGAVADAILALPPALTVTALVSTDAGVKTVAEGTGAEVTDALRRLACVGGQDGVPLLAAAMEAAGGAEDAVVVWVHGPQPVALESAEDLTRRLEWSGPRPQHRVIELAAVQGRNVAADALTQVARVEPLDRPGGAQANLAALFAGWASPRETWQATRTRGKVRPTEDARRGDVQIVRLWAQDEVGRLLASPEPERRVAAVNVAVSHHLVTPVSGAVVLENQAQYDAAGLSPAAAVPLPAGAWAALVTLPLALLAWRRMRKCAAA
jgi:hypothetical protein